MITQTVGEIPTLDLSLFQPADPDVRAALRVPEVHTFGLNQNYPNPFNPSTTIRYSLADESNVRLVIYNVLGQRIRSLVNETQTAGFYSMVWDGRDAFGLQVVTGLYLYRLEAGMNVAVRKMVFAK